jgi:hypothetical protein
MFWYKIIIEYLRASGSFRDKLDILTYRQKKEHKRDKRDKR